MISQVAVINDEDGFSNVRLEPNINSKVIYELQNFELFLYENNSLPENDWVKVYIPSNRYALDCFESNLKGYLHISRIKPIENLENYTGKDFSFRYELDTFKPKNKIIEYASDKSPSAINGRHFYGTDGELPKIQIKSIDIQVNENKIDIPKIFYEDIFEATNDFDVYKNLDFYIVKQWNSDGAGGYLLVWVFDKSSIKQRLILIP